MFKALTTAKELESNLLRAMRRYRRYRWSVAWASAGWPLFQELLSRKDRVARFAVGTHFRQTDPDFLAAFRHHPGVRAVLAPDGVFHPKIYLFENGASEWECVIGSPNFTVGGFRKNVEAAIIFDHRAPDAEAAVKVLRAAIDLHWKLGETITHELLARYRAQWRQAQPHLAAVAEHTIHRRFNTNEHYVPGAEAYALNKGVIAAWGDWKKHVGEVNRGDRVLLFTNGRGFVAGGTATGVTEKSDFRDRDGNRHIGLEMALGDPFHLEQPVSAEEARKTLDYRPGFRFRGTQQRLKSQSAPELWTLARSRAKKGA